MDANSCDDQEAGGTGRVTDEEGTLEIDLVVEAEKKVSNEEELIENFKSEEESLIEQSIQSNSFGTIDEEGNSGTESDDALEPTVGENHESSKLVENSGSTEKIQVQCGSALFTRTTKSRKMSQLTQFRLLKSGSLLTKIFALCKLIGVLIIAAYEYHFGVFQYEDQLLHAVAEPGEVVWLPYTLKKFPLYQCTVEFNSTGTVKNGLPMIIDLYDIDSANYTDTVRMEQMQFAKVHNKVQMATQTRNYFEDCSKYVRKLCVLGDYIYQVKDKASDISFNITVGNYTPGVTEVEIVAYNNYENFMRYLQGYDHPSTAVKLNRTTRKQFLFTFSGNDMPSKQKASFYFFAIKDIGGSLDWFTAEILGHRVYYNVSSFKPFCTMNNTNNYTCSLNGIDNNNRIILGHVRDYITSNAIGFEEIPQVKIFYKLHKIKPTSTGRGIVYGCVSLFLVPITIFIIGICILLWKPRNGTASSNAAARQPTRNQIECRKKCGRTCIVCAVCNLILQIMLVISISILVMLYVINGNLFSGKIIIFSNTNVVIPFSSHHKERSWFYDYNRSFEFEISNATCHSCPVDATVNVSAYAAVNCNELYETEEKYPPTESMMKQNQEIVHFNSCSNNPGVCILDQFVYALKANGTHLTYNITIVPFVPQKTKIRITAFDDYDYFKQHMDHKDLKNAIKIQNVNASRCLFSLKHSDMRKSSYLFILIKVTDGLSAVKGFMYSRFGVRVIVDREKQLWPLKTIQLNSNLEHSAVTGVKNDEICFVVFRYADEVELEPHSILQPKPSELIQISYKLLLSKDSSWKFIATMVIEANAYFVSLLLLCIFCGVWCGLRISVKRINKHNI